MVKKVNPNLVQVPLDRHDIIIDKVLDIHYNMCLGIIVFADVIIAKYFFGVVID